MSRIIRNILDTNDADFGKEAWANANALSYRDKVRDSLAAMPADVTDQVFAEKLFDLQNATLKNGRWDIKAHDARAVADNLALIDYNEWAGNKDHVSIAADHLSAMRQLLTQSEPGSDERHAVIEQAFQNAEHAMNTKFRSLIQGKAERFQSLLNAMDEQGKGR